MIGTTLGHYRIVDRLGAGGMGEVFRAEDITLKRQVALKVLPAELAEDSDRLERFQREAEALAALNHPNIVVIHSIESAEGVRFLTMELVEGKALAEAIPERGLGLGRIFDIAVPLADALGAAHAKGVVHRDIKPGNVMVTDEGRVKFLDFGLAKLHPVELGGDASQIETQPLTQEGLLIGTVPYMAPEQLEGDRADVRSDVFSLGVVLYEMATGERPFQGENPVALISSILQKSPQPVSAVRQELPPQLGRIIERCLAKDPDERFQSAGEIRDELSRLRYEIESGMTRTEISAKLPVPGMRKPGWKQLLAPVAVVAVIIAGASLWLARSERTGSEQRAVVAEVPKLVVLPFENLGPPDQAWFTDGMTEEITSRLAGIQGLRVISRMSASQYKDAAVSMEQIAEELGVDYVLDGTVRWAGGEDTRIRVTPQLIRVEDDSHLWSSTYDRVLADAFAVQSDIAREVIEQLGVTLLQGDPTALEVRPTDNAEAYEAYLKGRGFYEDFGNEESLLAAVQMFERAVELDPGFALPLLEVSGVYWDLGNSFERPGAFEASARALQRAQEMAPDLFEVRRELLWEEEDPDWRTEGFRALTEERPSDAMSWMGLGYGQLHRAEYAAGMADLLRAADLDPRNDTVLLSVAIAYTHLRRFVEGAEWYERLIAIGPHVSTNYWLAAQNEILSGDIAAARATLERMPERRDAWRDFYWWELLRLEGRFEEALEVLADAQLPPGSIFALSAEMHRALGDAEAERHAWIEAQAILESRLAEQLPEVGEISIQYAQDLSVLAVVYASLGQTEDALDVASRAAELEPIGIFMTTGQTDIAERVALTHLRLGDADAAIAHLDRLLSTTSVFSVPYLRLDHRFAPLREHPDFHSLLERHDGEVPVGSS